MPEGDAVMRRGFTLIELLVVIGIIGLLIGITLPVASSAIESARVVRCQANLRTIGQGLTMYLDAGDGLLPFAAWPADIAQDRLQAIEALSPHVGAPVPVWDDELDEAARFDPWVCPSDRVMAQHTGTSYTYSPYQFFQLLGRDFRREATTIYRTTRPPIPVFFDALRWHDARNELLIDGSVQRSRRR